MGESEERTLHFDIPEIVATGCEVLEPIVKAAPTESHYTTILLKGLRVRPRGRTLGKIRDHLRSMYRVFVRESRLSLWIDGDQITYEPPDFLRAPFHREPHGAVLTWRKDIEVDLGDGHAVRGWAGILARASVANAGFSIFRRGRLVEGSHGDGYRPESIFGSPNKFIYQRLIGELEVFGFSVSHTKDGIQWDDWEDDVLTFIREQLDSSPLPLLDQASNYRARAAVDYGDQAVTRAVEDTVVQFVQHVSPVLDSQIAEPTEPMEVPQRLDESDADSVSREITLQLTHARRLWTVKIELVAETSRENMYELAETDVGEVGTKIHIRINLDHPFVARFASPGGEELLLVTRLIAGLAVAEVTAREAGVKQAGTIRMNLNQILRSALSGPIQAGEKHVR